MGGIAPRGHRSGARAGRLLVVFFDRVILRSGENRLPRRATSDVDRGHGARRAPDVSPDRSRARELRRRTRDEPADLAGYARADARAVRARPAVLPEVLAVGTQRGV